jgi:hypothetical protein
VHTSVSVMGDADPPPPLNMSLPPPWLLASWQL